MPALSTTLLTRPEPPMVPVLAIAPPAIAALGPWRVIMPALGNAIGAFTVAAFWISIWPPLILPPAKFVRFKMVFVVATIAPPLLTSGAETPDATVNELVP